MRIAYVAAELAPYAQVGGLADVARWLPDALTRSGHEVVVVAPHYDVLDAGESSIEHLAHKELGPFGTVTVSELVADGPDGLRTLLVGSDRWFQRGAIYDGAPDEAVRFGALTAAVAAVSEAVGWVPEVIHANDWHTGLLRRLLRDSSLADVPMVFTIHNLAYQGVITAEVMGAMGFGSSSGTNSLREAVGYRRHGDDRQPDLRTTDHDPDSRRRARHEPPGTRRSPGGHPQWSR